MTSHSHKGFSACAVCGWRGVGHPGWDGDERLKRYAEVAVEVLELDVRRAHDRMVADDVAAKFMAVADAELAELRAALTDDEAAS